MYPGSSPGTLQRDPRTHGLWQASAPPAPATRPLAGELAVDVAVVGAGFTGCSAALHLAQGGASVAVLEACDIGFGGAGRNVGLVNAGLWVLPSVLQDGLGPVHGPRLLRLLGDAPAVVFDLVAKHGIACEAVRQGTLHCGVGAGGEAELRERARQWQALGAPVELLDAGAARERIGTGAYAAALLDRRAGTIQPLAYVRGLASAALGAGALVSTRTRVQGIDRIGGAWRLATDTGGEVRARWVLVATDAYTGEGGPWAGLQQEQVRLPYFNLATAPLPPELARSILPHREGAWDTRQVLSSFRFDAAGRLVFGSVGALRGTGAAIHRDWGRRALTRLFPALRDVGFEHAWYGTIGMTTDALPRLHRLAPDVLSFSGYNGRGIAPGTVFGRELARLVLGEIGEADLPLPVTEVRAAPWRGLREFGYEAGAQLFHAVDARWPRPGGTSRG